MKKKYLIPAGLLVVVLIFWFAFGSEETETAAVYASPKAGSFDVTITTSGELRAKNSTSIKGPENMREIRVYNVNIQKLVPEGTIVQKGDFIAELDRSNVLSALQDAQLNLDDKEVEFEQAQLDSSLTLSEARDNIVNLQYAAEQAKIVVEQSKYESPAVQRQAQIDHEKAERELEQAKKNYKTKVKQAQANLRQISTDVQKERNDLGKINKIMAQFEIYAPEKGMVIYERNRDGSKITEGNAISAWNPVVAELPDFSVMESITYVNEVDIQNVKNGQTVDIGLDAMPEKKLTGEVTDVANIGEQRPNSSSKVFQVVIKVNESDSTLRPSMTTQNVIQVNSLDSALYVPLETVHSVDSMDVVYIHDGQRPVMQQVVLGMMNDNDVVIKAGLSTDDQLYLSMPADTAGIRKETLSEDVLQKYREKEEKPKKDEMQPEQEHKFKRGQFPRHGDGPPPGGSGSGRKRDS